MQFFIIQNYCTKYEENREKYNVEFINFQVMNLSRLREGERVIKERKQSNRDQRLCVVNRNISR